VNNLRRQVLIFIALDEKDYPPIEKLLKSIKMKDLDFIFNRNLIKYLASIATIFTK